MTSFPSSAARNDTARVRAYQAKKNAIAALRRSNDPADQQAWRGIRDAVTSCARSLTSVEVEREVQRLLGSRDAIQRAISPSSVHGATFMANMSVEYANEDFIGDELMPTVPVSKLSDEYATYGKRDRLAIPDDSMQGRSSANEVSDSRSSSSYTCKAYGLKKSLEKKTIDNQDEVFDEMMDLNEQVAHLMAFAREKRIMTELTTTGNYGSNTAAIAAADRWNSTGGGDPILKIRTAAHECWRGNGPSRLIGFCPLNVYLVLGTHPAILDVTKYTKAGIVPREVLASLFELDDLLIAKAWNDTANEGQTASYARLTTSKCFGIVRVANTVSKRNVSFGYNFRFKGEMNNLSWYEEKEGTRGTYWNQQTVDEVLKIVASDAAYLYTTVID